MAFWRVDLGGRGPGYALADILAQAAAPALKADMINHVAPDILVLSGLDHDHDLHALQALRDLIAARGHDLAHVFSFPSNAGLRTGHDMNGDGRSDTADDTQGYGLFRGAKALAVLSRWPIDLTAARDFSGFLWRDLPGALLPPVHADVLAMQRLSSTGHWDVPVQISPNKRLHLLIYQAGPPVFGGPTDRNRLRNHDETAFWTLFLDGALPMPPPHAPFVLLGGSNLDPFDGDGMHVAMQTLLAHPALQDPLPASLGGLRSSRDAQHRGPPELDTVDWPQAGGPGNLRVSYVLPSRSLRVRDSGVLWPDAESPVTHLLGDPENPPTRHRLVWVDIESASLSSPPLVD